MADVVGGSVVWNLDVDSGKLDAGLSSAKNKVSDVAKSADKQFSNFANSAKSSFSKASSASMAFRNSLFSLKSVILGAGGAGIIGLGLKTAAEFETLETALRTVTGSSDAASEAMKTIKQVAKDSPFFEVSTLAQFTQLMAASGQAIDEAVESAIGFGDVAAAFGKGNAEMSRMGNTLSQVIGKGKADVVDFKELVNAGWVSVRTDTANALGVTMAQFEEMVSAGEVGYDAIRKASEKFAGSAEQSSTNLRSIWSRFKETIETTFANIVIETGVFDAVKNALSGIITTLEQFEPQIIQGIIDLFNFIKNNGLVIAGVIAGALIPSFTGLGAALSSFAILTGWAAVFGLIAYGIQLAIPHIQDFIEKMGGIGGIATTIKGKLQPIIDGVTWFGERIGQILSNQFGVSFEFGGLIDFFATMNKKIDWYTKRTIDIISDFYQKAKNFLAFGGTEGDASIIQTFEGIWNRLKPLRDTLEPLFTKLVAQFRLAGEVINTQIRPQFDALMQVMKPFGETVMPLIINMLKGFAILVGGVIAGVLGVLVGIMSGIVNALPVAMQALAGFVQAFRGVVQLITGILKGDFSLALEGFKQMAKGIFDFFINSFKAIYLFISGFVQGIILFFHGLYMALVGGSIVPDMINEIVEWFLSLPEKAFEALVSLIEKVVGIFTSTWTGIKNEVSTWPGKLMEWGKNIAEAFVNGFGNIKEMLVNKAKEALEAAKGFLKGESPPKEGPFKNIDKWGFNVGSAWVTGMSQAISMGTNELSSDLNRLAPVFDDFGGGSGFNQTVNVTTGPISSGVDISELGREFAFRTQSIPGVK